MSRISKKMRQQVLDRANGLCEYCQTSEELVLTIEIDHIIPIEAGGKNELGNLCVACDSCNSRKLDFQTGVDPETDQEVPLFNPRLQNWSEHFQWNEDGTIMVGLTTTGRATIHRLGCNREAVVRLRRRWVSVGWHPPKQFPLE
ncbi:MAG: HNH endonuclease [Chloroflexota bacterium]|nr:MAG: HNH endonuclease [Chloroflexota bacterium]